MASQRAAGFGEHDVSLSWMPLTHDMGLIGFHLMMVYSGTRQYLMPTDLFVRRALLWMKFASAKRATLTSSPNFGYRHFLKALGDKTLEGVDVSSIRLIFNGAEPISIDLASEFLDRMAPYGLRRNSMYTVYGLAEASLAVTSRSRARTSSTSRWTGARSGWARPPAWSARTTRRR